jgi:hypothetical protein
MLIQCKNDHTTFRNVQKWLCKPFFCQCTKRTKIKCFLTSLFNLKIKVENNPYDYFKSEDYDHSSKTKKIIGEHLVGVYGTCMVAAINYYIKKPLFKDNAALYEANKLLLLEKKKVPC